MKMTLLNAILNQEIKLVQKCISAGHDLNMQYDEGYNPLVLAVSLNSDKLLEIIQLLINSGADLNFQDHDGNTALHVCVICDHKDYLDLLLKAGADFSIKNKFNKNPLDLAIEYKNENLIKFIKTYSNYTDLHNSIVSLGLNQSCKKIKI